MWKDDARKKRIINAILAILIVASVCALGYIMFHIREQNNAYDAVLAEKSYAQQQQHAEAKQEAIEDLQKAYETDLETVAQYMPGIVCWGDQLTSGTFGNVSYPDVLQQYINTYICDAYNFSSTIENPQNFTRIDWSSYKVEIPVVNMGSGAETSGTVAARCGALPFKLSKDCVIPATTDTAPIYFATSNGISSTLLEDGDVGVNNVTIAGIEGKLSLSEGQYYFERCEAGDEITAPKGTEIITAASEMYKDYIHIIWIGTYGGYTSADDLVSQVKAIISRQTANSDRFIIMGPCGSNGGWEGNIALLNTVDARMLQEFGNNYINLRKYFCSDGMNDAGLTITKTDKADISIGAVPYSLRSVSGSLELTAEAYKLVGKVVYERMEKLGFFSEIREELQIPETTKNLLG